MGKDKQKVVEAPLTETYAMLNTVDSRISAIVRRRAGDKLPAVVDFAEDLILMYGKTTERALADALEKYNLV